MKLLKRFAWRMIDDDLLGWSAQLSFYFFLTLFPVLICFVALASFLPVDNLTDLVLALLEKIAPPDVLALVTRQLVVIAERRSAGLLTFGLIGTVWTASAAMQTLVRTLNFAYHVPETRPWWRVRLRSIALTLVMATFAVVSLTSVLIGPGLGERAAAVLHLSDVFLSTWQIVHWPIIISLAISALAFVYHVGPDASVRWPSTIPGACFAAAVWIGASLGLRWAVSSLATYEKTYGTIGAALVILLWFYVSGLAMLAGAELNSVMGES